MLPLSGLLFYLASAALVWRRALGFLCTILLSCMFGVHCGLITSMILVGNICATCLLLSIVCLFATLAWSFPQGGRVIARTVMLVSIVAASTILISLPHVWAMTEIKPPDNGVKLIVFEMHGCSACKAFEEQVVPRLSKDDPTVVVERRIVTGSDWFIRSVPTLFIVGSTGKRIPLKDPFDYDRLRIGIGFCR